PQPFLRAVDDDVDDDEPEYDPDEQDVEFDFPISHELFMKDHTKVVSALAVDPSGARFVTGSHDYDCKLWDFGGMGASPKPFKSWEPASTYYIHDLKFSSDGTKFLVISGTIQPKLYDRDGEEVATYIKGDMYIRDMKHTAGHVGELTCCAWHPKDPNTFITSSADSTVRIWDVENKRKQKTVIVVKSKERGTRTKVTTCAYSYDAKYIGGACFDGTLHMWKANSNFVRPDMTIEGAHTKGTETGSMVFSVDGRTVLTRGGDDTVKLWDLRSFRKPLATRSNIPTLYPTTNAVFSPDEKHIITGSGSTTKGGKGKLLFLRKGDLEPVRELEMDSTPVKVLWHPKINQILVGQANGQVSCLYSPEHSLNGAKLLANKSHVKRPTVESMSSAVLQPQIITPHALPMFRDGDDGRSGKRKREKERLDPRKSKRPELPVTGPGRGGRVGASATQHVVQNLFRDTTRDQDPREALLKYADLADKDPQWTSAWRQNQPNPPALMSAPSDALAVEATVVNDLNKASSILNGSNGVLVSTDNVDNGALSSAPDSPAIPSPSTNAASPPVKIDLDYAQRESDARHEPISISLSKIDDQTAAASDTSPASMDGNVNGVNGTNGVHEINGLDEANEVDGVAYPVNMNVDTPFASSSRVSEMNDGDAGDFDQPPPAKRARKLSDAEQASLAHSPAPPPPPSTAAKSDDSNRRSATPSPPKERKATLSQQQFRFCISTVRQLRKLKDATPFLKPVDAVALNIPHYHSIIKRPTDFSTIDRKLASSNPTKPDPNPNNPRYLNADEFVADVRQIFENAATFNGPEHVVTQMGKRVEAVFDKQIKQLPLPAEEKLPTPQPPAPPVPTKKASIARRPSTSIPTIRRNDTTETARPKREIHPPPPKDLPYAEPPKKVRTARKGKANDGTEDQLKYCAKILADLHKKSLAPIASPFYEPVDPVKLGIPAYPRVVKKPMDMSTMKKKLENKEYATADKFYNDFALMIKNCMAFNPVGTDVQAAGVELQRVFEEKWNGLPPLRGQSDEEEDEEDEDSEEERNRECTIVLMESQIESMKGDLAALKSKSKKPKKEKKEKKREKHISPPIASSSKTNGRPTKSAPKKKSSKKAAIPNDDVLSFDQKKDLSETITTLEGDKLQKVIDIIHEGVPEIRDSTEEIELDIDQLPAPVLMKLYNYVLRPLRSAPTKRSRTGTGTGTGGLKRKSMDEDLEAEKIRQLEERMKMFDKQHPTGMGMGKRDDDSEHSSDDSSSDSSGSDSE
ncbi:hypothetical protein DFH11DRAFT_1500401, partial [Phellopilus nigrolimitatus]